MLPLSSADVALKVLMPISIKMMTIIDDHGNYISDNVAQNNKGWLCWMTPIASAVLLFATRH